MRVGLDALLQPSGPEAVAEAENGTLPDGRLGAPCIHLRAGPVARWWTGVTAMFELPELYEVGFLPKETP